MEIEIARMSSKGQVVIPQEIRNEVKAGAGTTFAVIGSGDTITLKKIFVPSKENVLKGIIEFSKKSRKRLEALGIQEADIPRIVEESRRKRR